MSVYAVRVGFTSRRPIVPDEHTAYVQVAADTGTEARLVACQMVGAAAVIIARFIGIVRTFMPVAAGVGRMPWPLFFRLDVLGGLLWGAGLPLLGWGVAHIPGVADLVTEYIDLVLLGVVAIAICFIVWHAIQSRREVEREIRDGSATGAVETLDLSGTGQQPGIER